MKGEGKAATDALRVEKPPVAMAAKAWFTASYQSMPSTFSSRISAEVSSR